MFPRILAVVVCCSLAILGAIGRPPVLAAATSCQELAAGVQSMASSMRVQVAHRDIVAGEGLELSWAFKPQQRRQPIYMMIGVDRPARFSGKGFYVLQPTARAPFALGHAADKARIVVPLYVSGGQTSRIIKIFPVLAGDVTLEAHVVGPSECGEQTVAVLPPTRITVAPGKPEIEIADDGLMAAAKDVILSSAGDRAIEVTGDKTFRLVTWPNRQLIVSLAGSLPRFSPTGRFFSTIDGSTTDVAIRDAIDGHQLMATSTSTFSWENKDSFIIESSSGFGAVEVRQPAAGGLTSGVTNLGCRPCPGIGSTATRIDLENNLVLAASSSANELAAYSLTEDFSYSDGMWANDDDQKKHGSVLRFAALFSQVAPLSFPEKRQEFVDKPQFPYEPDYPYSHDMKKALLKKLIKSYGLVPVLRPAANSNYPHNAASPPGSAKLSRSVSVIVPSFDATRRSFNSRLSDFGIPDHPVIRFQHVPDAIGSPTDQPPVLGAPPVFRPYKYDPLVFVNPHDEIDEKRPTPDASGRIKLNLPNARFWVTEIGKHRLSLIGGGRQGGSAGSGYSVIGLLDSKRPGAIRPIGSGIPFLLTLNPGPTCSFETCRHRSALSHGRYLLMWSPSGIEMIDLQGDGSTRAFKPFRADAIDRVSLSPDARFIIQRNSDGTFALHDVRLETTGEQPPDAVLFGRYADDEIVAWTSSGHFDATHEGAAQVNLRFAGLTDLYSFDQFASLMHTPGLVGLVLKGTYKDSPIAHRIPPTIIGSIRADGDRIRISVQQKSGRRLTRLLIYEDGLRTEDRTVKEDTTIAIDKPRLPGVRYVTVVGTDGDGLASQPLHAEMGPAPTKRSLKVLGIGVDSYFDKRLPRLAFAKSDVNRVIKAVTTSKSQVYDRVEASTLYDAAATRDAVMTGLKHILDAGDVDTDVMLIFAGHGMKASDGGYYLALTETNTADLRPTSVDWSEVADLVNLSRSRVTIVLDSCHSGDAGKGLFATNDDIASRLVANTGGNVVVLAGAKGREYSLELKELSGGVFSTALARALANARGATDLNRNGVIEATEIYASVRRFVTEISRGRQTPWIVRNKMIGDFAWF